MSAEQDHQAASEDTEPGSEAVVSVHRLDGLDASDGFDGYMEGVPVTVGDEIHRWLSTYTSPLDPRDLDVLALWVLHTFMVARQATYTTPRLLLTSPLPESGKTTVLEHLSRLCHHPVLVASLGSAALLPRLLAAGSRTILLDEADRNLRPDREGVADLLAVLNSGYKRGGTRPVLRPVGDRWVAEDLPTFAPVALAGIDPVLPDDTASRTISVLMLPDHSGAVAESDWEQLEDAAEGLHDQASEWAEGIEALPEVELPPGCLGRMRRSGSRSRASPQFSAAPGRNAAPP